MRRFFAALSLVASFAALPSVEAKEVRVYSGRHYNTDRAAYKEFSDETGIKVRLIEATGISLVERLKREGENSNADVILLVDAARINNAAEADLLQPVSSKELQSNVPSRYRDPYSNLSNYLPHYPCCLPDSYHLLHRTLGGYDHSVLHL